MKFYFTKTLMDFETRGVIILENMFLNLEKNDKNNLFS